MRSKRERKARQVICNIYKNRDLFYGVKYFINYTNQYYYNFGSSVFGVDFFDKVGLGGNMGVNALSMNINNPVIPVAVQPVNHSLFPTYIHVVIYARTQFNASPAPTI